MSRVSDRSEQPRSRARSGRDLPWLAAAWLACAPAAAAPEAPNDRPSFAVYALSRGSGVPEGARSALDAVRGWLEDASARGIAIRVEQSRIGLEGEMRLCAEFEDPNEFRALRERVRARVAGIALVDFREEPCARSPHQPPLPRGDRP